MLALTFLMRILVVDDDEDVREALGLMLHKAGHEVSFARDGVEAFEMLARMSTRPSLVVLDMMMPRMNGNEFLEEVSKQPHLSRMPVIVVSTSAEFVHRGATRIFTKPVDVERLLCAVDECGRESVVPSKA